MRDPAAAVGGLYGCRQWSGKCESLQSILERWIWAWRLKAAARQCPGMASWAAGAAEQGDGGNPEAMGTQEQRLPRWGNERDMFWIPSYRSDGPAEAPSPCPPRPAPPHR